MADGRGECDLPRGWQYALSGCPNGAHAVIQVFLSGGLVLGAFGLPKLGMTGAAVSAVVSASVVSLVMVFRLLNGSQPIRLHLAACRFSRVLYKDILNVFLPASLSPIMNTATIIGLTALVGQFGASALAGFGIGSRVELLLIPLIFGVGAAMTSLVGMNVGAGKIDRAHHIAFIGGVLAMVIVGILGLSLALFRDSWIGVFSTDPETVDAARRYILIVGPFFAFQGLGLSLYFAAQGAGKMFWPAVATIARVLIAIGGASLLAFHLNFGINGIFYAASLSMVVYATIIASSIYNGAWRR